MSQRSERNRICKRNSSVCNRAVIQTTFVSSREAWFSMSFAFAKGWAYQAKRIRPPLPWLASPLGEGDVSFVG